MGHAGNAVYIHLVWATWQRKPLIQEAIRSPLYHAILASCKQKRCRVLAIGGMEDHVHLLVELALTTAIAELMHAVKGSSSHLVTHTLSPETFFKWQEGYGTVSVSPFGLDNVIAYIHNQREHHAAGTLHSRLESIPTPAPRSTAQEPSRNPAQPPRNESRS